MDPINRLAALFAEFPGIGGRQSKRFVFHLLKRDKAYINELVKLIQSLQSSVFECSQCHRYFMKRYPDAPEKCFICIDTSRDHHTLMVVEKDSDLEAVERSGTYKGLYFILGGTLTILEKDPSRKLRFNALLDLVSQEKDTIEEVIIACAVTPESEHTAEYVESMLLPLIHETNTKITHLGRGLSTGTELEYSDADTLRYALEGRK